MGVFSENAIIGASAAGGYEIEKSVVFSDSNAYYNRTPSGAGNRKTWTWSCWVKHSTVASDYWENLFGAYTDVNNYAYIVIEDDVLRFFDYQSGSAVASTSTSEPKYRDPAAWRHIVITLDTTQATDTNRLKFYINGEQLTLPASVTYPSQNADGLINSAINHRIAGNINGEFDGYLAEMHFIDGTALNASSFGETNADTNQWIPKQYSGSYGTNGFYLDFATRATDPIDASGNGNNWSSSNVLATDWRIDTPTNNFCTLNPLDADTFSGYSLVEGNLEMKCSSTAHTGRVRSTFNIDSGKWYWEVHLKDISSSALNVNTEVQDISYAVTRNAGDTGGYNRNWATTTPDNSVIMVAFNADIGALWYGLNGTWDGSATSSEIAAGTTTNANFSSMPTTATYAYRYVDQAGSSGAERATHNFGQDSSFAGQKTAQGNQDGNDKGDFYYTPPTGYLALCTDNLPDPSIADPTDHFATTLYTGDGNSTQSISTEGNFDPEFAWVKIRSGSWGADNHVLYDIVRGDGKRLQSNTTGVESDLTSYGNQVAFATGGITVGSTNSGYNGQVNENSNLYVNWNWKAGGTAVSNTDGTITSSVSANTTAGFSIVSWTGNLASNTIGHGLSQAPELIIVKDRDGSRTWPMNIENVTGTANQYLRLDHTDSAATSAAYWGAAPGASTFTVGDSGNTNSASAMIAYCFHSVDGYSKVGKYAGNGAQDGSFVYTGFRPAFIFIKRITNAGSNSYIVDNKRIGYNHFVYLTDAGSNKYLWPDSNAAEGNGNTTKGIGMDILSNGFKFRTSGGDYNASSNDYLFYAIAETPFKTANAR